MEGKVVITVTVSNPKLSAVAIREILVDALEGELLGQADDVHLSMAGHSGVSIDLHE